ncbi:MAG TPA: O-antigen ligase family protein [Phycisphaerae bacterium]|nr:O-antigen ligase family protein [Phycisphaerae bacterium]
MSKPQREDGQLTGFAAGDLTIFERLALLVLVALIPLRAVISETRTFEVARLLRHLDTPPGAMPATTTAIFAVILGAAVLVAAVRLWQGGRAYRWTGSELGIAVLAIAMTVSTARAGQKHLALTGSLDFLGLLLYLLTLRQLLVRPWHVRLVLIAILATGAMVAAKCAYQRWVEIPDTIQYYEEHKAEFTQDSGADDRSSGMLHDFEQRMRSGAVSGYFQHPNVLASYLILVIMTAAAVAQSRWRRRPVWTLIMPALIGVAAFAALYFAQSKGAAAACGVAILIWLFTSRFSDVIRRRPYAIAAAFWTAFAIAAVALVATLQARPESLGRSMLFRSFYWQGASTLIRDQGLWGIGADNFGRYFSRYKAVECPEDVEDPHSWPVKALAEWGAVGLTGMFAVFLGVSLRLAKGEGKPDRILLVGSHVVEADQAGGSIVLWTGAIGAIVFASWAALLAGSPQDFTILVLYLPAILWVISSITVSCESSASRFVANDVPGPMLTTLCAGMIGFLIHTGIDLAMFQGGAATTFFAIMAVALAVRDARWESTDRVVVPSPKKSAGVVVGAFGFVGIVLFVAFVVRPMAIAGAALQEARTSGKGNLWEEYQNSGGYQAYIRAIDAWPLDGTAVDELVEELTRRASTIEQVDFAAEYARMLQTRDPQNASTHHYLATLYFRRFSRTNDPADRDRSIASMLRAVEMYPTSPNRRLVLATLYEQFARLTDSPELRRLAAAELQNALDLDDRRIYVSAPNRLGAENRAAIQDRLSQLAVPTSQP